MKYLIASLLALSLAASAQAPRVDKIDPPNWWPQLPAPMLLLHGEHLDDTTFTLSDKSLKIDHATPSANGHYVQLWLKASPAHAEAIRIEANGKPVATYQFETRHAASDGFAGFSSKDVMYLIMTDRFVNGDPTNDGPDHASELAKPRGWHGGDLRGITQHLDYLQHLGITTVWITPVYQNHEAQSYHGYGATDLYAVDEHYGTLADYRELAAALHQRHMKLVLDTVPNHIGPAHPWVADSPDPTWFHGTLEHHTVAQGEFAPLTDPHAPWRDQRNVTQGWFANILPDMNQEDSAVAKYLTQNSIWWIEQAGLDGLRIDTFPYVGRAFWHDFHATIHALYPHLTTVGEVFNGDPTVTSTFAGGVTRTGPQNAIDTGLDTPFDFPTYFALRDVFLKDAPMTKLADVLRLDNLYPHPERLVPFLGNHDNSRFMNDPAATPAKLSLAFTILTTMRGMPQIYSGDELAMKGGEDPDNRHDFPLTAFQSATRTPDEQKAYNVLEHLLAIRQSHPALQTGTEQVLTSTASTLVYVRTLNEQHVLVAINKASTAQTITIDTEATDIEAKHPTTMLVGDEHDITLNAKTLNLRMPAESALIAELN
jgi:glycosidase